MILLTKRFVLLNLLGPLVLVNDSKIFTGIASVQRHTEKSCIASYYTQFSNFDNKIKLIAVLLTLALSPYDITKLVLIL